VTATTVNPSADSNDRNAADTALARYRVRLTAQAARLAAIARLDEPRRTLAYAALAADLHPTAGAR